MKDVMYKIDRYSKWDIQGLASHFEMMAEDGWMIENIGAVFNKYRRQRPKKVEFSLMFIDRSGDNPIVATPAQDFIDMRCDMGWEHIITHNSNLHVFVNSDPNATPLETDCVTQAKNIASFIKARAAVPLAVMIVFFDDIYRAIETYNKHPFFFFSHGYNDTFVLSVIIIAIYLAVGIYYLLKARKLVNVAQEEDRLIPLKTSGTGYLMVMVVLITAAYISGLALGLWASFMVVLFGVIAWASKHISVGYWYKSGGKERKSKGYLAAAIMLVAITGYIAIAWYIVYKDTDIRRIPQDEVYIESSHLTIGTKYIFESDTPNAYRYGIYDYVITDNQKIFENMYNDLRTQGSNRYLQFERLKGEDFGADTVLYRENLYLITKGNTIISLHPQDLLTQQDICEIVSAY